MNDENLIPIKELSSEEAKRRGRIGGLKSAEAKDKRKLVSQVLHEMFEKKYNAKTNSLYDCVDKIFDKSDGATVSLLKTILEATEGKKLMIDPVKIKVIFGNDNSDPADIPTDDIPADPV